MRLFMGCLQGLDKLQGKPYHIEVDPSVPPKRNQCRSVPVQQQAAFKQELAEMKVAGNIKPLNHAMPWTKSFVIGIKNTA